MHARAVADALRAPIERFLHRETAGGIVLLVVAAVALIWANSPLSESYHHLWHTPIEISIGGWHAAPTVHFLINDGLMTIFFLVVGLEIKREIVQGELSDLRRASLPVACAIGGMVAPALIYFALNPSGDAARGWGVPMATDIAFAVGVLSLLGKRVPAAMRVLLLAIAIIDDLGAILVIALFYTTQLDPVGVAIVVVGAATLFGFIRVGVRPGPAHLIPLGILWTGLLITGIHPTLAGVMVGLATPVKAWLRKEQFVTIAADSIDEFRKLSAEHADDHELRGPIRQLTLASREVVSPVVRGEEQMHPWVAFGIMPLFALANAGVNLAGVDTSSSTSILVMLGVGLGLAVGKPLGVLLAAGIAVKMGWSALPRGVTWPGILVLGLVAGIGFTMSIFIAELAFAGAPGLLGGAKLAILIATAVAGIGGLLAGRLLCDEVDPEIARLSAADVEASTEY